MNPDEEIASQTVLLQSTKRHLWLFLYTLVGVVIFLLFVDLLLVYAVVWRFPAKQFLWTSNAATVCAATTLDEPNVTAARVKDFAQQAGVSINSYDYANWRRLLDSALDAYFTQAGRVNYRAALDTTRVLDEVRQRYYTVTATTPDAPHILSEGIVGGRYTWTVQVPLTIYYRLGATVLPEGRLLTMTIIRVDPSPANPNGIAIDGLKSEQKSFISGN